ncbi:MAG TPA: protein BatD [bacterium]|nr:protein BatD [bacterium]
MTGKKIFPILCLLLTAISVNTVYGNEIELTSVVNSTKISLNDRLILSVTVSGSGFGNIGDPMLAPIPDFTISGTSSSTKYNILSGTMSFSKTFTYVLIPKRVGAFSVGAVSIKAGRKNITAPATKVEVVRGAVPQAQTGPKTQTIPDTQSSQIKGNKNIFINTFVDRKEPYVGEQITYTFELYNRISLAKPEYEPPSTTGFWQAELPQIPDSYKNKDGRTYNYHVIKTALFPTTSGELTLGPASLYYSARRGIFSFGDRYKLQSDPIIIKAKNLPKKGEPRDYNGAVGNFNISSSVENKTVKAGDVITLRVSVTGRGNLDLITSINEPDLTAFKMYDPKVSEKISNSGFVLGGSKTWEYIIIPRQQGDVSIEPFSLPFFNPEDKSYHTVTTQTIELKVVQGDAIAFGETDDNNLRDSISKIAPDIRYIKPDKKILKSISKYWYSSMFFYLLYILPLAAFITSIFVKKRQDEIERNTGLKRKLNAWKNAQKRLDNASEVLKTGDIKGFCGKLHESITFYIGDMLNVDTGTLTSTGLEKIMKNNGISPELAERISKTLEMCDFVRFASVETGTGTHESILNDTRDIISKLRETL